MESTKETETVEATSKEEDAAEDEASSEDEENSEDEPVDEPPLRTLSRKPRAAGDPYQKLCGHRVGILIDVSGSTTNYKDKYKKALRVVRDNLAGTGSVVGVRPFADQAPARPNRGFAPVELDGPGLAKFDRFIDDLDKEWPSIKTENDLVNSNYSIALKSALGKGYDEIILIGDGYIENGGLVPGRSGTYSGRVFDSIDYADQLRAEGTRLVSLKLDNRNTENAKVYWSDSPYGLNNYFPDELDPPPGFERGTEGAVRSKNKNRKQLVKTKWSKVQGEVGSRTGFAQGRRSPLYVNWVFRSTKEYLDRLTDRLIKTDYDQMAEHLDALTSGCTGTVTVNKKLVDANGKVNNQADTSGFTFRADRAFVDQREESDVERSTGKKGLATFNFAVEKDGTTSMSIQEILEEGSVHKLRPQDVSGGKKTVATCEIKNLGKGVNVSYGSGSDRVVTSDVSNNSFTISGLRGNDIVNCTVHNTAGEPDLSIAKSASTEPRVITSDGQEFQASYHVSVKNSGTAEGTPESIRELPAAPQGLRILRVEVDDPEITGNSLIKEPIELNNDGSAWVLPKSAMKPVPAKMTRSAKVNVIYRVDNMADLQGNLECPDGGLTNRVELDGDNNAEACVGLSIPSVGVVKFINGEDADTREEAATTTGGGDTTITYDIRNDGTAPLERFTITDERLDPETGNPAGAIVPEGLTCNRDSRVEKQGDTITVIPNEPLANGPVITCTWTSANLAAEPGEYHANRVTVSASAAVPGNQKLEEGDIAPVSATDDAWLFTLPVLTGNMPLTGGKGVWPFLLAGLALALGGAFALRRKTA
ncbi:LPXTG cell wall anchor domain-containing protein [Corynebacterium sp. TAE3-ERU30]|uniref:LPXTG cell wall anchor domain-containing protein n=1 Tax=Corynebacterium sp. TAE3-ERU30 TaxID=2849496 RepID=UPI001C469001|nr:LPXTG cell wall anchor domain-containing protein [Corynebacterium sp. TAE3-ERU30]MBV7282594.1 LPXTG cell wall anchor domain-containing protein [Corynebacterium sp. TAE3-ERU30]